MTSNSTAHRILNTSHFLSTQRNNIEGNKMYCYFCKNENRSHRAPGFTKVSSLDRHIRQAHDQESKSEIKFVLEIVRFLSYSIELGIVR